MTEIAIREESALELAPAAQYQSQTVARLTEWAAEARAAGAIAKSLCDTSFVPKHFRGAPAETTAAILTGFEVGLPPMAALRSIYVIGGTPAMYAATMRALVISKGHEIWVEESTDTRVVMAGRRKGSDVVQRVTWTMDRAKKAGLLSNPHYTKNPQNMLTARCSAELCRLIAPDVIHGIPHAVEELDDEAAPSTTTDMEPAPKPKKRTAQRAQVQAEPAAEPELAEPVEVVAEPAEDRPTGGITPSQSRMMHALFNKAGVGSREERMAYVVQQIGREVESSNELSKDEAKKVIDSLDVPDEPELDTDWPATAVAGE